MEGTLSKWTNVVHGWQHRYFVLNEDALNYYTSKEKMARGQQRGCIRLRGAALGIDEENHSQFTIAVDGKVFHLQGKSQTERDIWVRALERVIHEKCGYYKPPQEDPLQDLNKRVTTAESQSHMLMEQTRNLEQINKESEKADQKRRKMLSEILLTAKRLQSTVEHSVILLKQVQRDFGMDNKQQQQKLIRSKESLVSVNGNGNNREETSTDAEVPEQSKRLITHQQQMMQEEEMNGKEEEITKGELTLLSEEPDVDQIVSYSSSDDEFYDATDEGNRHGSSDSKAVQKTSGSPAVSVDVHPSRRGSKESFGTRKHSHHHHHRRSSAMNKDEMDWGQFDQKQVDYDAIYDNTQEHDVGDINKQHGSVLMHLLSQVSVGMDLTKVTLPTFILERRSLLEMYADFFAHPDDFINAVDLQSAEARFLAVVKYYLNSFYPARKSGVAKKPYNPILGETFRCRWTLPGTSPSVTKTDTGPFPGSSTNQVTFIAEQVSHHPPISAFYAEHPDAGVSCTAHIYTKSSFLGLSIGVHMIGNGTVKIHKHDETYVATFPNGYGRSIMSTPWIELGGKVEIRCDKTQYRAEIEFLTKPFFRGKPHQIHGQIFHESIIGGASGGATPRKPIMQLKGEWNGNIYIRRGETGDYQLFSNVRQKPDVRKECVPVMEQEDRESRKLWRHVTAALFHENIEVASQAKRWIEQRQRNEKEKRDRLGQQWQTRFFERLGDGSPTDAWRYRHPLEDRRQQNCDTTTSP